VSGLYRFGLYPVKLCPNQTVMVLIMISMRMSNIMMNKYGVENMGRITTDWRQNTREKVALTPGGVSAK